MAKTRRDLDKFRRLAEIWGGAVERWPEAERDWARGDGADAGGDGDFGCGAKARCLDDRAP